MGKKISQEFLNISKRNLDRMLAKIMRFPVVSSEAEVNLALESLVVYHCVKQVNILQVLRDKKIKVKNIIFVAEMTNETSDSVQGFDEHISMSVGDPWTEYGQYSFAFGIDKLSDNSLIFMQDPWQFKNKELQDSFLTKKDFLILVKETCLRRVRFFKISFLSEKPYVFRSWNKDLEVLIRKNFSSYEVKQTKCLNLNDAEEFFIWTYLDYLVQILVRILWRPPTLIIWFMLLAFLLYTGGLL